MKKYLSPAVALALGWCMASASPSFSTPDFSLPLNVIADADSVLRNSHNDIDITKAVIQITVAKTAIDPDSIFITPNIVQDYTCKVSSPACKALLYLFQADLFSEIYQEYQSDFDSRDAPIDPLPAKIELWNKDQIQRRSFELLDSAMTLLYSNAGNARIDNFNGIIEIGEKERPFFPTLRDFGYCISNEIYSIYSPDKAYSFIETIVSKTTPGTPPWAYWINLGRKVNHVAIYERYPDGLTGAYTLSLIANKPGTDVQQCIKLLQAYLENNTANIFTKQLQYALIRLTRPTASISIPTIVTTGKPVDIVISSSFVKEAVINVYSINDGTKIKLPFNPDGSNSSIMLTRTFSYDGNSYMKSDTLSFTPKSDGKIFVELTFDNDNTQRQSQFITSTSITPFVASWNDRNAIALVNVSDGSPVKGATIMVGDSVAGITNANGLLTFFSPSADFRSRITAIKNNRVYDFGNEIYLTDSKRYFNTGQVSAEFFINRPLYHPGDTVQWSAVLGRYDNITRNAIACKGIEFDIAMYDANNQGVDTITVTSDAMGCANGKFVIPQERITGYYSLRLVSTSYAQLKPAHEYTRFMVSDFKVPTFEIKDLNASVSPTGILEITGKAITYSGMAVNGAKVDVAIETMYGWWSRNMPAQDPVNYTTITAEDGYFKISVGNDENKLEPRNNYSINVTVTDAASETVSGSTSLYLNDAITISYTGNPTWNSDNRKPLPVHAYTGSGKVFETEAHWTLIAKSDNRVVATGQCLVTKNGCDIDLSRYPAAAYRMTFAPVENIECTSDTFDITTYSIDRNAVPASVKIIVDSSVDSAAPGKKAKFNVGFPRKTVAYVFTAIPGMLSGAERRVFSPGFHTIESPELEAGQTVAITIAVHDGLSFHREALTANGIDPYDLVLKVESWRDNITPGNTETITMRLTDTYGNPARGAVTATMYNHALDALQSYYPGFFTIHDGNCMFPSYDYNSVAGTYTNKINANINYLVYRSKLKSSSRHLFITPGFTYSIRDNIRYSAPLYMSRGYRMNALNSAVTMTADREETVESEVLVLEDCGTPMMSAGAVKFDKQASGTESPANTDLRPGAVYDALWRPGIAVDTSGIASISFIAPRANGTWHFMATAWNENLRCSSVDKTTVSSKPVMIQPNLPRFLRSGDKPTAAITVYNNTDTDNQVSIAVSVFNPTSNDIITSTTFDIDVNARQSEVIRFPFDYSPEISTLGLRISATMGNYTDGEVNYLPVLASELIAIDSENFYLTSENQSFTCKVPNEINAQSVIQYCANPVWDAVKALPSLFDYKPTTSTGAATAIFAALTTRGLSRKYPEINRAISQWMSNPEDSALVSRLYKNEQLKVATLQQSPWVATAASETDRMQALALTFDNSQIKGQLNRAIDVLESMQLGDGGFAWGTWNRASSFWMTASVLQIIGRLNVWGFLTGNSRLDKIIDKAFCYLENNIDHNEYIYASTAVLYPHRLQSTQAAKQAMATAAQNAIKEWKSASTVMKARYALLLNATGYENVAREIVNSISQFEVKSPIAGISFPSVDRIDDYAIIMQAFATIKPDQHQLDGMRQWLILRTQVTDDLGTWDPTSLITAILSTGNRWTTLKSPVASVSIDGSPLSISNIEEITGSFNSTVNKMGATINVMRNTDTQGVSYGSLSTVYKAPLDSIQARGSSQLSIDKRFLTEDGNNWEVTTSFASGQKVRVQLTITIKRDLEYVTIIDERPAAFEPENQLPGRIYQGGLSLYRESSDSRTRFFIDYMPAGTYTITYDAFTNNSGTYASGPAIIQSQYAPEINARSGACRINITAD